MKRRKFIIGMGSLAAGSAAAMGTGALSASEVDRDATGQIVGDAEAYLRLVPYGENSEFARVKNGQLMLAFDDGGDAAPLNTQGKSEGEGLNADSVNYFDGVFRISANNNGNPFEVWVESHRDRLDFYVSNGVGQGKDYPLPCGPNNKYELSTGGNTNIDIGVKVDLENNYRMGEILGGDNDFTIHAERA